LRPSPAAPAGTCKNRNNCVSVSNQLQQWTNFCTKFSPKKVVWGGGRVPPADKSGGTPSRASQPHYTGAVCGRVWRRTVVRSTSDGRADGRADDVGSARDLVALAIPVVVGADHVEPLARHRLQLAVPPPHRHTHTHTHRSITRAVYSHGPSLVSRFGG